MIGNYKTKTRGRNSGRLSPFFSSRFFHPCPKQRACSQAIWDHIAKGVNKSGPTTLDHILRPVTKTIFISYHVLIQSCYVYAPFLLLKPELSLTLVTYHDVTSTYLFYWLSKSRFCKTKIHFLPHICPFIPNQLITFRTDTDGKNVDQIANYKLAFLLTC